MATDSDATTAMLDEMGKAARAAAQKHNTDFDPPPERPSVTAQRNENDAYGRKFSPWRK